MSYPTEPRAGQPANRPSATLYQRGGIAVTQCWLTVANRRYRIDELTNLRTARGSRRPLKAFTFSAAGGLAVVLIAATQAFSISAWAGIAAALALPAVIIAIAAANRPQPCELWADYRGLTVQLLWLDNREHYNQVCRAITRAKERAGR